MLLLCMVLLHLSTKSLLAPNPSFHQQYYDIGYKSMMKSLTECEQQFQREIQLPRQEPPVEFTHRFGRCHYSKDVKDEINNHYEAEYLHQYKGENHFMIRVNPLKYKLKGFPRVSETIRTYTLKDGTKAVYGTTPMERSFNVLVFDKDGWQYIFSSDRRLETITGDVLVQVADSIITLADASS